MFYLHRFEKRTV